MNDKNHELLGQIITGITVSDDELTILVQGAVLKLSDVGQNCCEYRHMTVEDDLTYYVGSAFMGWELKEGPTEYDQGDVHDILFLEIHTSRGSFQVSSHNHHNGYYGGFDIRETIDFARAAA